MLNFLSNDVKLLLYIEYSFVCKYLKKNKKTTKCTAITLYKTSSKELFSQYNFMQFELT